MRLCLLLSLLSLAAPLRPVFQHYTTDSGLSQVTVRTITEDGRGCIWMGTSDGLNCLSGQSWRTFRHDALDPSSIPGDEIQYLYSDSAGQIWVFTNMGVALCDPLTGIFSPYVQGPPALSCVLDLRDQEAGACFCAGRLLLGSAQGLFVSDGPDSPCTQLWASPGAVSNICLAGGDIWATVSHAGLFRLGADGSVGCTLALDGVSISNCLTSSEDGSLWFGWSNGLIHYDPATGGARLFTVEDGLTSNAVRTLDFDSEGRLWVGTANNVTILFPDGQTQAIRHVPGDDSSLGNSSIHSIRRDHSGGMWVGSFYGGADYWHPLASTVCSIPLPLTGRGDDDVIRSLQCTPDGRIWVSTSVSGILCYDPESGQTLQLMSPPAGQEGESAVNAICFSPDGVLALLGHSVSGLSWLGEDLQVLGRIQEAGWVFSIEPVRLGPEFLGEYLVGTSDGVYVLDIPRSDFYCLKRSLTSPRRVFYATIDSSGTLWTGFYDRTERDEIVVGGGKIIVSNNIATYPEISMMQGMVESSSRRWFASNQGLFSIGTGGGTSARWGVGNGWPTNMMRGIERDLSGRLWISTENGLIWLEPDTGEWRLWGREDGLKSTKFNPYAHCRGLDGTLYFGGNHGVYAIRPAPAESDSLQPATPAVIEVRLDGVPVSGGRGHLRLSPQTRTLEITLDLPDFISGKTASLEYMLEGVDDGWQTCDHTRRISYADIPHGTHRFLARSRNAAGLYCDQPLVVEVGMRSVWYRHPAFFILLAAALASLLVFVFLQRESASTSRLQAAQDKARQDISRIRAENIAGRPLNPKELEFVTQMLGIIESNISNKMFGVQELAAAMGMSRSNLNIRLKAISTRTPLDIIQRLRLECAFSLMNSGEPVTVSEVAERAGFGSATYFATFFKKETGLTPTAWMSSRCK